MVLPCINQNNSVSIAQIGRFCKKKCSRIIKLKTNDANAKIKTKKYQNQLNRIAVRRLLLRMRKLVAISCLGLIFDPNDATTKNKFLSTVTPILDNIKANRGISDYKIEVNDTVESRERRELPAKIYFKPINALEYITLDFIVTPEAVSFENI